MNEEVRRAIEAADAEALHRLVAPAPERVEADVVWGPGGKNAVPPLHFVCDAVFRGLATQEEALALANVLLAAGADPGRAYARSGDTFLIAAASLGAELVGLRLVELGVDVRARGLFGATALHWSSIMGLERLTRALVEAGSELELADERYDCTPLQWALHGWNAGTSGRREELPAVVRTLVEHGARVRPGDLDSLVGEANREMRAALGPPA